MAGRRGKPAHSFSYFDVENDAWQYDATTNAYYLHYFSEKQPDLNWENPQLRQDIYKIMTFWCDKCIDGFRMDVIPYISRDTSFPVLADEYKGSFFKYYAEVPFIQQYLQEMNRELLSKYPIMTVAEGAGINIETA